MPLRQLVEELTGVDIATASQDLAREMSEMAVSPILELQHVAAPPPTAVETRQHVVRLFAPPFRARRTPARSPPRCRVRVAAHPTALSRFGGDRRVPCTHLGRGRKQLLLMARLGSPSLLFGGCRPQRAHVGRDFAV